VTFLHDVLPEARRHLTETNLEWEMGLKGLVHPYSALRRRANLLGAALRSAWGIDGRLDQVPREPRWVINATTYETGKNWRFMPQRMGDYDVGYVLEPRLPVAEATAASAAFPVFIGPYVLPTHEYSWVRYRDGGLRETDPLTMPFRSLHLWDGGLYDNLGLEAVYKMDTEQFREGIDFLIVSDGGAALKRTGPRPRLSLVTRSIDITTSQVRALRSRSIVGKFQRERNVGIYAALGTSPRKILTDAMVGGKVSADLLARCAPDEVVETAAAVGTRLRRLTIHEFEHLRRHGWDTANCTLSGYCPDLFEFTRWAG
jgi:NTE family protein